VDQIKPDEKYKSYKKEIKNEWNRNPENPHTKKGRETILYKETSIYWSLLVKSNYLD
jgi:hypothetical protein